MCYDSSACVNGFGCGVCNNRGFSYQSLQHFTAPHLHFRLFRSSFFSSFFFVLVGWFLYTLRKGNPSLLSEGWAPSTVPLPSPKKREEGAEWLRFDFIELALTFACVLFVFSLLQCRSCQGRLCPRFGACWRMWGGSWECLWCFMCASLRPCGPWRETALDCTSFI